MNQRLYLRLDWALLRILCSLLGLLLVSATSTASRGVSPYLPLNISPEIERQIDRLLVVAGDAVLTRPIPAARVHDVLASSYCQKPNTLCRQVRGYLERYKNGDGVAYFNMELNYGKDDRFPLANERGENSDNSVSINGQLYLRMSQNWYAFLGGERREDGESLEGTYSSLGWEWMQLDVGYRPHWLSPMKSRSMLWSTNAETTPSVSLSNPVSLGKLGFRYELFATRLSDSQRIESENGLTSGGPCAVGMHFSVQPHRAFSAGINRVAMYGGGSRGKCHSPNKFIDAVFDPESSDKSYKVATSEFGTQLVSLSSRLNVSTHVPFSIYAVYDGEGASNEGSFRLDDSAKHLGIYFPSLLPELDLRAEFSTWTSGWYQHPNYGDGFATNGNTIGLGDVDTLGLGVQAEGDAAFLSLGWQHKVGRLFQLSLHGERYESAAIDLVDALEVRSRYSFAWNNRVWGLEGRIGKSAYDDSFSRVGAFVRW